MVWPEIAVLQPGSAGQFRRDPGGVTEHDVAGGLPSLGVAEPDERIVTVIDGKPHELDSATPENLLVRR